MKDEGMLGETNLKVHKADFILQTFLGLRHL